jgi:hypothetical protein
VGTMTGALPETSGSEHLERGRIANVSVKATIAQKIDQATFILAAEGLAIPFTDGLDVRGGFASDDRHR